MTAKLKGPISALFFLTALYDGVLGALFLIAPGAVFQYFNVAPPNHMGYVQFSAALIIVFGLMFLQIAQNPVSNRHLIIYGMLLKLAYCSLVFWYWFTASVPDLWKPFAVIDVVTLGLFAWSYAILGRSPAPT